jgi:hypothetical protein
MTDPGKGKRWTEAVVISLAIALGFNYWWTKKLNDDAQAGGLPSIENEQIASFDGQLNGGIVGSHVSPPNFPYYSWGSRSASNWVDGGRSVVTNSTGTWAA